MVVRWADVPDTHGWYQASDHGEVRSVGHWVEYVDGRKPRWFDGVLLTPTENERGYQVYTLHLKDRRERTVQAQSLVLEAFVGPRPDDKPQIRHLDGNPRNNQIDNLCYATHIENRADMTLHGRDHYATRTHCKWGHPYEEQWNIQPFKGEGDKRICRACNCATSALNRNGANRKESPRLFKVVGDFYLNVFREGRDPRGCLTPAIYASLVVIASRQAPLDIPKPREEGE